MARSSLKSKRKYIKGLITRANKKIEELIKNGVLQDSFAYQTAMDTRSKAKHVKYGEDRELAFSIEGMKSGRELDREKGRILAFLSNATSEAENATIEKKAPITKQTLLAKPSTPSVRFTLLTIPVIIIIANR